VQPQEVLQGGCQYLTVKMAANQSFLCHLATNFRNQNTPHLKATLYSIQSIQGDHVSARKPAGILLKPM
jgi:hypothetical protein